MTVRTHIRTLISGFLLLMALLAMLIALLFSSTAHAAPVPRSISIPSGWHVLYNVGQDRCLNLIRGNTLQRCDRRNDEQQYAALTMSDGGIMLINRATAECLTATGIRTLSQRACNDRHRGESMVWAWEWMGSSTYHLLIDHRALTYRSSGTGGLGMTFAMPNNADLNQDWKFQ